RPHRAADEPDPGDARLVLRRAGRARRLREPEPLFHHLRRRAPSRRVRELRTPHAARAQHGAHDQADGAAGSAPHGVHVRDTRRAGREYVRLKERGIRPFFCVNHGPTTSMYFRDPDGNRVELQIDNFATAEEGVAWMYSPAFDKNPIGVEYDPDQLVARFQAG